MTIGIKSIKGIKYYYFQDSGKINGKSKTITTCICRTDLAPKEVVDAKLEAFPKHMIKIFKATSLIQKITYHFEHIYKSNDTLVDSLEFFKLIYEGILKNLSPQELEDFSKNLFSKYVHGTTAIEGNTLSEEEAHKLLATGLTVNNKTVNETLEVANYNRTREFLDGYSGDITEKMVKQIHRLLMSGITSTNDKSVKGGEYRTNQVILRGIEFTPSRAEIVPESVKLLIMEYADGIKNKIHPIELASYFHQKFEEIHPFSDGNGRVGRELLNFMLKRNGYPPIYILENKRSDYLNALQKGNKENYQVLFDLIIERISGTMQYLYSKTSIYEKLTSKQAETLATKIGAKDVYERYVTIASKYHTSEELP